MTKPLDLTALRALCDAATSGPWHTRFTAAARTALLLDEIERLRAECERLRGVVDERLRYDMACAESGTLVAERAVITAAEAWRDHNAARAHPMRLIPSDAFEKALFDAIDVMRAARGKLEKP
jgi:hypothetical protein